MSSPAEGFLLSRIDGLTPWRMLREIAGLDAAEVDGCLERWISDGAVTCEAGRRASRRRKRLAPGEIDEDLIDESIDLNVDLQRRILQFESGLDRPDHEVLGIPPDSDAKVVKRAYFALSKEFHPDRFFRREIGEYSERLHKIFKRILDVYELLSDPALRAEVEKSKSMEAAAGGAPVSTPAPEPATPKAPPRELTPLERLRVRMPMKLPDSVLIERKQHAEDFYRASSKAESSGSFSEAATLRRLAIAFDPFNDDYRSGFAEISARSAQQRAERLLSEAEDAEGPSRSGAAPHKDALRLYEEALLYRPHDPELNQRAALCAIEVDQVAKAFEYAETAVEHSPELASCHLTLARVFEVRGDRGHALHELAKAVELDPEDREARTLLAKLRASGN